jgi:hypothetical protein
LRREFEDEGIAYRATIGYLEALSAAAVNRLPADQYAVGSAVNQATRQIGSVLGVAVTVLTLGQGALTHGTFLPLYVC